MCGIVGLFLKDKTLEPKFGAMLQQMLGTMCERGPDSAGFAIYCDAKPGKMKITIRPSSEVSDFSAIGQKISEASGASVEVHRRGTHWVVSAAVKDEAAVLQAIAGLGRQISVVGSGRRMEVYKEVGLPSDVARTFGLGSMSGSHGIGHTRMATESAVTTRGAHPFSTGPDQCLVHNGSLSNHNAVRRELKREGLTFATENDTEVAAGYLYVENEDRVSSWRCSGGSRSTISMDSTRLSLAPRPGLACCAIRGVQAGRDGGDRQVRRVRFGVPRACRSSRHRGRARVGTGAGNRLFLGAPLMPVIDLATSSVRELNQALHGLVAQTNESDWRVLNPRGLHNHCGRHRRSGDDRGRRTRWLLLRRHEQAGVRYDLRQRRTGGC